VRSSPTQVLKEKRVASGNPSGERVDTWSLPDFLDSIVHHECQRRGMHTHRNQDAGQC
jgi:hypothetical protein